LQKKPVIGGDPKPVSSACDLQELHS